MCVNNDGNYSCECPTGYKFHTGNEDLLLYGIVGRNNDKLDECSGKQLYILQILC